MKTTSRFAVAAAASVLATSAMAADLGGNCCADLEERVAELEATAARKGNRKMSLTIYGHVNKAIVWHDDEAGYREGKLTVRDNSQAASRFGFRGEAQVRPDLTAGFRIEIGLNENYGTKNDEAFDIRHSYVYLNSKTFGQVTLGQDSQVTDGLTHINLATTRITPMKTSEVGNFLSPEYRTTFNTTFSGDRRQGVYYQSPTLGGFILSAGWSHEEPKGGYPDTIEDWELALRYAGEFNGVRIAGGVGYRHEDDNKPAATKADVWMASGSVMHTPSGLFLSGGYAERDSNDNTKDQSGFWVMAGLAKNWFGPGTTTVYAEYGDIDFKRNGTTLANHQHDGNYWGLGAVQSIDAAATDLYINFRNYELEDVKALGADGEGDSASAVVAGMIVRF